MMKLIFTTLLVLGTSLTVFAAEKEYDQEYWDRVQNHLENPEPDYNRVYKVVGKECKEGVLDTSIGIGIGTTMTHDFFYRDSNVVNELLENGGWDVIELPYPVGGANDSVCRNNGNPTDLIIKVQRIQYKRPTE